ncbi:Monogalactosyldiacylglycerol synthase 1 [Abeliophyllum distichum]|uniref:Monogalactosyldiacylglycerol synthase 1 n=1 Tax=Abeliophyllum distichum TaxID=126358 RepID=A0ABD1SFM0_9LAMI
MVASVDLTSTLFVAFPPKRKESKIKRKTSITQPSTVTKEPTNPFRFVSELGFFAFNYSRHNRDGHSALLTNYLYFHAEKKPNDVASLSLGTNGSAYKFKSVLNQFNRAIKFHCERILLNFSKDRVNSKEKNGFRNDGHGYLKDSERVPVNGDFESSKKVLNLISNTGEGHRASVEAIKVAFRKEYGCSTVTKFSEEG